MVNCHSIQNHSRKNRKWDIKYVEWSQFDMTLADICQSGTQTVQLRLIYTNNRLYISIDTELSLLKGSPHCP